MSNYDCATEAGYTAHVRRNDPPCAVCKEWKKRQAAGLVQAKPVRSKAQVAKCGTVTGYKRHRANGEAACKSCREANAAYERDRAGRSPDARGRMRANLRPCGTMAAYQRHKRAGEEPCGPCKEAKRMSSLRARSTPPRDLLPCGTVAAYHRHKRAGEDVCNACREAQRVHSREKRAREILKGTEGARRPHAGRKPINHGTTAGRSQHVRRGETPCDPCRLAFNAYNKEYNATRKKAA